ncbi:abortive phage infection protein [Streptomyces sporangiiformans]|uniref:Abortive phage infection protein n=1 Tax=Streptomyces sporangiiformans TaxID=2315329 RepID=A0A505CUX3_9ACTN|nr:abortive phage infection protein [Streptomyces sporangiiformans]TPQ15863.1 abortive phage infection protein [Streptomyces sporangiiformans]
MEKTKGKTGISRARFMAGAAAVGGAVAAGGFAAPAPASAAVAEARRGLKHRGIVYTVGEGETPGTAWSARRMREDVRVIGEELHADSVEVTGDGVERLNATASEVAERGLHVWLQPTLGDVPQREILEHLAESGRHGERLRRQGAQVTLAVGCEFWLFVPGILPGDDVFERIENLQKGNYDPAKMKKRLARFTAKAAAVGRSVFHGKLSYAAAQDEWLEKVDWGLFDIVGIDYYSYLPRKADYVRELSKYLRWGKPLAITEFGTCTFKGAPEAGGMGWDIVDHSKNPPQIKGNRVRSERTQAAYLTDLLDVFESMNLHAAMTFEFVTADAPHRPDNPLYDLDMAAYAIVKSIKDRPDDPASDWHWEPKQAFHAVARHYGRATC